MSMFENDQFCWRETYFVLFQSAKRPTLKKVQKTLGTLDPHYVLANAEADERGRFESVTVLAPDDFAALDISYVEGEEVLEQAAGLLKEIKTSECRAEDRARLEKVGKANARFDVLHFEQIVDAEGDDDAEGMLDPSTLLLVLDALTKLTDGVAIDPQSGGLV